MKLTCCFSGTPNKGISFVTRVTLADWIVIIDRTGCVDAAHARTRIPALLIHAGEVGGALLVDCALRLALDVRVSLEAR